MTFPCDPEGNGSFPVKPRTVWLGLMETWDFLTPSPPALCVPEPPPLCTGGLCTWTLRMLAVRVQSPASSQVAAFPAFVSFAWKQGGLLCNTSHFREKERHQGRTLLSAEERENPWVGMSLPKLCPCTANAAGVSLQSPPSRKGKKLSSVFHS